MIQNSTTAESAHVFSASEVKINALLVRLEAFIEPFMSLLLGPPPAASTHLEFGEAID